MTSLPALILFNLGGAAFGWGALPAQALPPKAPFHVVIDPGHGGIDHGTIFKDPKPPKDAPSRVSEKEVTLALAEETAKVLRARGYLVSLTRDTDTDLSVPARTAFANKVKADLFVSIHMNSAQGAQGAARAEGIETFILNNATDASSRRLAELENSVLGDSDRQSPEQTDVALILKDLRLDANLAASKRLACAVQSNLTSAKQARSRGVRQALFYVLLGADMPSILVEAGFLTSAQDRARVLSNDGRRAIANGIARAIDQYRGASKAPHLLTSCKVN